jgi:hypothetical protein
VGVALALGLSAAVIAAVRIKRRDEQKRRETLLILSELEDLVVFNLTPPRADENSTADGREIDEPDDEAGQVQLRRESRGKIVRLNHTHETGKTFLERGTTSWIPLKGHEKSVVLWPRKVVLDAWGNPIRYRHPGTVHGHGWDLYSVGPDGIDDHGGGDDILVGGDIAGETSAR